MSKQDRQGVRHPAELERKYSFEKRFRANQELANEAKETAKNVDRSLDQTEIFNRLTNYGKAHGLFLDDEGNLFINASFLTTGILKSLDGKTFYLDLVKGILRGQFEEFSISGKTVEQIASDASNKAQQYADKAAQNAVNSQTQTDVFNKLTNNGTAQGIHYRNGQLYINASYLAAGILKTLDGSTFHLDLAKNTLKILGKTVSWQENEDGTYTLVGK